MMKCLKMRLTDCKAGKKKKKKKKKKGSLVLGYDDDIEKFFFLPLCSKDLEMCWLWITQRVLFRITSEFSWLGYILLSTKSFFPLSCLSWNSSQALVGVKRGCY